MARAPVSKKVANLFEAMKQGLVEAGFDPIRPYEGPSIVLDIPRPAFCLELTYKGIDLEGVLSDFKRTPREAFEDRYTSAIRLLQIATYNGRSTSGHWYTAAFNDQTATAVVSQIAVGYYDAPPGAVTPAYHAAELAYLAWARSNGQASLWKSDDSFYAKWGDSVFGVINGHAVLPDGTPVPQRPGFDLSLFLGVPRYCSLCIEPAKLALWGRVAAFLQRPGTDPGLILLCGFLRWRLDKTANWNEPLASERFRPPPVERKSVAERKAWPVSVKIATLEDAIERLDQDPRRPTLDLARILCPRVISWPEWKATINNTRATRDRSPSNIAYKPLRAKLVACLEDLKQQEEEETNGLQSRGDR